MKKLILLNTALLIALFSHKFPLRNWLEKPRILSALEIQIDDPIPQELKREQAGPVADAPKTEDPITTVVDPPGIEPPQEPTILVSSPQVEPPKEPAILASPPHIEPVQKPTILVEHPRIEPAKEPAILVSSPQVEPPKELLVEEPVIFAKHPLEGSKEPVYAYQESSSFPQSYHRYPLPKRIALSHTEGWGEHIRPYRSNYTMGEILFAPDVEIDAFLPMLDLRGIRFDNGYGAFSVGFVGRYVPDPNYSCNVLGFNVYYDYAPYPHGYENQFGLGLEILGERLDFRGNFYAPFGRDNNCCKRRCLNGWMAYSFNAEIGYLLAKSSNEEFFLYTAVGPYYMSVCKCEEKKRGVLFRLVPQFKDILAFDLRYSYDSVFKSIFQAEVILSLPLYQVRRQENGPCGITSRQIYQRVERL